MGTLPQPAAATLKNLHKFVRLISLLFEGRVQCAVSTLSTEK